MRTKVEVHKYEYIPCSDAGGMGVCCSSRGRVLSRSDRENRPWRSATLMNTSTVTFFFPVERWRESVRDGEREGEELK